MMVSREKIIMDKYDIRRTLMRLSHEIVEKNKSTENLVIIGIRKRGDILADRIAQNLEMIEGIKVPTGVLDTTLYRDDVDIENLKKPVFNYTDITFSIDKKHVVLVDDVLYTGRTIRAAMDGLMDFGRPDSIQLLVLIDREHRELPIEANYVGKNVPTSRRELIKVNLNEIDKVENVVICEVEPE
jgi:pyrimidine operon attenuation protein/uracil phosphoribosyltransferase